MPNSILITGCTHGIGQGLALHFAGLGFKTLAVGRDATLIRELAKSSANIIPIVADITNEQNREAIFNAAKTKNPLYFIHNAGIATPTLISSLTEKSLKEHFETNLFAPILLNQMFLPILKKGSRILHITSNAADMALPGLMPYCISKAALERATHCLNVELNEKEIYFANLRPGMVDTNMQKKLREADETNLPNKSFYIQAKADNSLRQPDAVAKFIAWVLLKTTNLEFTQTLWNINNQKY